MQYTDIKRLSMVIKVHSVLSFTSLLDNPLTATVSIGMLDVKYEAGLWSPKGANSSILSVGEGSWQGSLMKNSFTSFG
jgi:hypothetical protein